MQSYVTSFVALFEQGDRENPVVRRIEIPLIQRDYAQGRAGATVEQIRLNFLRALRAAVVGDTALSLDFVYGGVRNGTLQPLDGQQRLTTLFLLHWYLASRAGSLQSGQAWAHFTYATRPSARLFCERLVGHALPPDRTSVAAWITDQPWYQYTWSHDPTIQSMLVMLDAIDDCFGEVDAHAAWARMTDPANPAVSFHLLPMPGDTLDEDRYIKMNSRGKPLTEFENFKARFEQQIAQSCPDRVAEFATKVDGPWADMLWPYHGGDFLVDDEFLRYFHFLTEVAEWRAGTGDAVPAAPATPPTTHDADRPTRNGVRRPGPGSLCGMAWALFDAITAESGRPATVQEALSRAGELNHNNIRTEHSLWRRFHGLGKFAELPAAPTVQPGNFVEGDIGPLAERIYSGPDAADRLQFLIHGFDIWVGADIEAVFAELFARDGVSTSPEAAELYGSARNVFAECCRKYGEGRGQGRSFSLAQSLYLYAVLWHRMKGTSDAPRRLRVIRNLVEASSSELRGDRMRAMLEGVELIMSSGTVEGVAGFNPSQIAEEAAKSTLLAAHPSAAAPMFKLEDEPILRGCLAAFTLDAGRLGRRQEAFHEVFGDQSLWKLATGALLATGDYWRHLNARFLQFGSASQLGAWRDLFTGVARERTTRTRDTLEAFLDDYLGRVGTPAERLNAISADFVAAREADGELDWRYYFVKYPVMREGASGRYVGVHGELGYSICMLSKTQMNSWYRDPFLSALHRAVQAPDRFETPVFIGYESNPRWLRLKSSGIGLRSVDAGFALDAPASSANSASFQRCCDDFEVRAGLLQIPQTEVSGRQVDTVDRIEVGGRFLSALLSTRR